MESAYISSTRHMEVLVLLLRHPSIHFQHLIRVILSSVQIDIQELDYRYVSSRSSWYYLLGNIRIGVSVLD